MQNHECADDFMEVLDTVKVENQAVEGCDYIEMYITETKYKNVKQLKIVAREDNRPWDMDFKGYNFISNIEYTDKNNSFDYIEKIIKDNYHELCELAGKKQFKVISKILNDSNNENIDDIYVAKKQILEVL